MAWQSLVRWLLPAALVGAVAVVVVAQQRPRPASEMAETARAFLASLTAEQREKTAFPFESDNRRSFGYTPFVRQGLPFKEMTEAQRGLATAFLRAGVSEAGHQKVLGILEIEAILGAIEGRPERRDPELYYFAIFGEPADTGTWAWRFEGHHLSLNYTVVRGEMIATTPQFLGVNPAEVRSGPRQGLRVLHAEEDLARALVQSLDDTQRAAAVISGSAPRDIITGNRRRAEPLPLEGITADRLTAEQRQQLNRILEEYARVQRPELAEERLAKVRRAAPEQVYFAWAGGLERGQPHYYRIQGPDFLVEYDNTQSNANHIHSVWRDFDGDWGEDLLRRHYETADPDHGHDGHHHGDGVYHQHPR